MKRNFSIVLTNLEGGALEDQPGRSFRLADACVNALLFNHQDETTLAGEEKLRRYQLAKRIQPARFHDLDAEELALIKRLIGKMYGPVVVGPAFTALETDPVEDAIAVPRDPR